MMGYCVERMCQRNVLLNDLHREFKITFSKAEFFVGLQIERSRDEGKLRIHQSTYAEEVLRRFNHEKCNPVSTPAEPGIKLSSIGQDTKENVIFPYRQAIGSLMYLMVGTRPDIAHIVGVLSKFLEKRIEHWNAVKRVLKYLWGTTDYGINFSYDSRDTTLIAYSDADFAGDIDKRLSTTGWVCFMNSGPIAWSSKRQTVTATSTTEAEFIALCSTTKEVI